MNPTITLLKRDLLPIVVNAAREAIVLFFYRLVEALCEEPGRHHRGPAVRRRRRRSRQLRPTD